MCITGASRGLGYALAEAFLEMPNVEVLAVTRNVKALGSLQEKFQDRLHPVHANICSSEGREQVFDALKSLPDLGALLHNAGTLAFEPFIDTDERTLEDVYRVNVFAPYLLTQKLMPLMKRTHVINISSVGGVQGSLKFAGLSAYSSSKAALNCLTEMWSEEFKDTQLTFNCLALGSVETEMFQTAFPGFQAACSPIQMAAYIVNFAFEAPSVMRGKIISLSLGNP